MAGIWYRAGAVSVTSGSKKVTGFGTQWQTSTWKVEKGHVWYGPDGKPYEIDYVESDTVLYLVTAYGGPTAASQSYAIDITRTGTIPAFSRQLSAQLAYAQGQFESWQQILTGANMVTLTAPDGQQVQVPSFSAMQVSSDSLKALQALLPVKDKIPFFSGPTAAELADFTALARSFVAATDIIAARKVLSLPTAGGLGFRNKLINGAMQVAQRGGGGTVPAGSTTYTLDRWNIYSNNQAVAWSQQGGPSGASGASLLFNGAANTEIIIRQRIEARNCLELVGNKVTLSYCLYGQNAAAVKVTPSLNVPTAADNFTGISLLQSAQPVAVPGPVFTKFSFTFDAMPASVLNGLEVVFTTNGFNTGAVLAISNVQLEVGEIATPFEYRPYGQELALCQRYYETGYFYSVGYIGASAGQPLSPIAFLVEKRTAPSIAFTGVTYANCSAIAVYGPKPNIAWLTVTGTVSAQAYAHGTYIASSEL